MFKKKKEENFTENDLIKCEKALKFIKKKNKDMKKKKSNKELLLCDKEVKQEFDKYINTIRENHPEIEMTGNTISNLFKNLVQNQSFEEIIP